MYSHEYKSENGKPLYNSNMVTISCPPMVISDFLKGYGESELDTEMTAEERGRIISNLMCGIQTKSIILVEHKKEGHIYYECVGGQDIYQAITSFVHGGEEVSDSHIMTFYNRRYEDWDLFSQRTLRMTSLRVYVISKGFSVEESVFNEQVNNLIQDLQL